MVTACRYLSDRSLQTYFCGPGPIAKALKEATLANTCKDIEFSLAKEHF